MLRPSGVIFVPAFSGAKLLRIDTVMAGFHHGIQSFGMQHLGAKIRQLRRLAIRNYWDGARFGDQPRIGGKHAVHIGPDDHFAASMAAPRIVAE